MGFFDKLISGFSGGSTETCPECGASLIGADKGGWVEGRFECPACVNGGVYFMEGGILVDSMNRGSSRDDSCEVCQSSLSSGVRYLPYEDGSNSHAYIKCSSCGHDNIHYGLGEEE